MPLLLLMTGLFNLSGYFANRRRQYSLMARSTMLRSFVTVGSSLILGIVGLGFLGLVSGNILGLIVAKFGGFFSVAPMWAYVLSSILSIAIGLYAWGILGEVNKTSIMAHLIKYRLLGGFLIGIIFGLVSTPCASAPLIAIISAAANSGYMHAYGLILTFALGHSLLLLAAGISVGFAQSIATNQTLTKMSSYLNKGFAIMLIALGFYFAYEAYLQI